MNTEAVDKAELSRMVEAWFAEDPELVAMFGPDRMQFSPESRAAQAMVGQELKAGRVAVRDIERWY